MARSRNIAEQREALTDAVWAVLAARGPLGLTLRAVAQEAGCTTGLVLHTFADKRALLLHARDVLHERTLRAADLAEHGATDAEEALRAVVEGALPLDEEGRAEGRVWFGFLAAAMHDDELRARHAKHSGAMVARLERLIHAAYPDVDATGASLELTSVIEGMNALALGDPVLWSRTRQLAVVATHLSRLGGGRGGRGPGNR